MAEDEFNQPFVDIDEWRDDPVRHRYLHGGFTGTELRFSLYLPTAEQYDGRFFQHITPVPDNEHLAQGQTGEQDKIGFSIASGAYFLETNGGGPSGRPGSDIDPTIAAYRANAAAAQHSRAMAAEMYGQHRPYGYAYGGSGGGYRTIGGAENTTGVWDGFVPYVIGSPVAIPNCFTVRMHAQRVLRHRLDEIADAVDAGGSGDPYGTLDDEERAALLEVTRMGFPLRSWFGHRTMGLHAFPLLFQGVAAADPSYFDQYWTDPGHLGHEAPPSLRRDIVRHPADVVAVLSEREAAEAGGRAGRLSGQVRGGVDTAWQSEDEGPAAIRLTGAPDVDVLGAELVVISGAATGARIQLLTVDDDLAVIGHLDAEVVSRLRPGDAVEVDNRRYLAAQTYHRHQDPGDGYPVWDQFRQADGSPVYPQRPLLLGPLFAQAAAGTVQTGRFEGRMIVVASLLDREAFPWQADWYRTQVREHLGADTDDRFRLWYVDHALHGDDEAQEHPTRTVSYLGVLHQALRDVADWVEQDVAPPPTSRYEVADGQIVVPSDAAERGGVQPVVTLTANGGDRAEVGQDDEVVLHAVAEAPDSTGEIVSVEWDLDGSGTFAVREAVEHAPRVVVERRCSFPGAGTWFPTVRVAAQRRPDSTPYGRIQILARTRVVVG